MFRSFAGKAILFAMTIFVYFFLYAPIVMMVVYSFNDSKLNIAWQGFTLQWYASLWRNAYVLESMGNSLVVAMISTLLSVVLGTTAAYGMYRFSQRWARLLEGLVFIPLVIPEVVLGVSLLLLFVITGVNLGLHTIIIAHTVFGMSFVAVVVRSRLAGMDPALEQAAMDLGADWLTCFTKIVLPLITPGIVAGGLLAFTISMDDFVVTFFTAGVGSTTLPLRIYSMLKLGVTPEINALSTILVGIIILLVLLAQIVLRRGANGKKELKRGHQY